MVVVASIGVALVAWSVGLILFVASLRRRRGQSMRPVLRSLFRRPTLWLGTTLIVLAVNTTAAAALLAAYLVLALFLVARRVRPRPGTPRRGGGR